MTQTQQLTIAMFIWSQNVTFISEPVKKHFDGEFADYEVFEQYKDKKGKHYICFL